MQAGSGPARRRVPAQKYLSVRADRSGGRSVLYLEGELDLGSSPQLKAEIDRTLRAGAASVVVDVRELRFMDMAGLRVLLGGQERAEREGGRLVISGVREPIRRTLALARVRNALSVE